jgi:hydrogenase maturation protease
MTAIKIFGIGSPQGADQIGWQAIEHLKRDRALQDLPSDSVKFITLDRPGLALLDYLEGTDYAILIDAIAGGTTGNIVDVEETQLLADSMNLSSHSAGIAEALAMGSVLNTLPKEIKVFGIETGKLSHCYTPDLSVLYQLNRLVLDHVQNHLNSVS